MYSIHFKLKVQSIIDTFKLNYASNVDFIHYAEFNVLIYYINILTIVCKINII